MTAAQTRRDFITGLASSVAGAVGPAGSALAQWPSRPVRIVVPFPPGGGADLTSRLIAPPLQQTLGQPFVIENRAGAAGRIGTGLVAKADPDGETLLVTTESSIVIAPHLGVSMNYDPLAELIPISLLTRNTIILVVHPALGVTTLSEFIALCRAKPGQITYGSSGVGGPNHLAGEIFKKQTGLDIVHVPFQGTGAAIQSVIANQVSAMWGFMAGLVPHVRAGALRALASGGNRRSPALPDVPTFADAGVSGYTAVSWVGMFAPHGTDAKIVDKLASAVRNAMQTQHVRDVLAQDGAEVAATASAEFHDVVAADYAKYATYADLLKGSQQ